MKNINICDKDASHRGHKRKLSSTQRDDESSCCSSEDEERLRKRYPVLSPASSSCHSVPIGSPKPQPEDSDGGGNSVKDLEHAMSKHLPVVLDKTPTDFSTDTLLKQQQQRSTIQWIGAHHLPQHSQSPGAPLPASALLRQLYANRESVIRANVHAGRSGGSSGSYYTGDMNHVGPLPTPPGSEGSYGDQFVLAHNQKSGDTFGSLVSSFPTPSGYTVDYHSAMTPPSSVSPRDKHQQVHTAFDNPAYSDVLRHQYNIPLSTESPAQPLPLKPQPYPVHPTAIDYAQSGLDQSQFYHHSAGFHLYHPSNKTPSASSTVYPETLKNSANWYSTPS